MHSRGFMNAIKWNWTKGSLFNTCHVGVYFHRKCVSWGKSEGSLRSIPEWVGDSWEKEAQHSSKFRTILSATHIAGVCMLENSSLSLWGQGVESREQAAFIVHCPKLDRKHLLGWINLQLGALNWHPAPVFPSERTASWDRRFSGA